jgi:dihydroorotate dehydrogenase
MYKEILRPLFFKLDPELIHDLVLKSAILCEKIPGFLPLLQIICKVKTINSTQNPIHLWGQTFIHPVGLAAGFLKNGEALSFFESLGFSFLEIGSVTAASCLGNPLPRIYRVPKERALINRMGLNNLGIDAVLSSLEAKKLKNGNLPIVGINIAKTHDPSILGDKAIEDILYSFKKILAKNIFTYMALNISCPNTKEGKTFEDLAAFRELMQALQSLPISSNIPLLIKLSPALSEKQVRDLAECALEFKVNGFIAGNTIPTERGGLSGAPLKEKSLKLIQHLSQVTEKSPSHPIIGVGGIETANDVKEKLAAGASLVQMYTGFIYEGPRVLSKICNYSQLSTLSLKTCHDVDTKN